MLLKIIAGMGLLEEFWIYVTMLSKMGAIKIEKLGLMDKLKFLSAANKLY